MADTTKVTTPGVPAYCGVETGVADVNVCTTGPTVSLKSADVATGPRLSLNATDTFSTATKTPGLSTAGLLPSLTPASSTTGARLSGGATTGPNSVLSAASTLQSAASLVLPPFVFPGAIQTTMAASAYNAITGKLNLNLTPSADPGKTTAMTEAALHDGAAQVVLSINLDKPGDVHELTGKLGDYLYTNVLASADPSKAEGARQARDVLAAVNKADNSDLTMQEVANQFAIASLYVFNDGAAKGDADSTHRRVIIPTPEAMVAMLRDPAIQQRVINNLIATGKLHGPPERIAQIMQAALSGMPEHARPNSGGETAPALQTSITVRDASGQLVAPDRIQAQRQDASGQTRTEDIIVTGKRYSGLRSEQAKFARHPQGGFRSIAPRVNPTIDVSGVTEDSAASDINEGSVRVATASRAEVKADAVGTALRGVAGPDVMRWIGRESAKRADRREMASADIRAQHKARRESPQLMRLAEGAVDSKGHQTPPVLGLRLRRGGGSIV